MSGHRQIVAGDPSRQLAPRASGLLGAVDTITVPSVADKIAAHVAGPGGGFVPLHLIGEHLARGALVTKSTESEPEHGEQVALYVAWRADARGKAIGLVAGAPGRT